MDLYNHLASSKYISISNIITLFAPKIMEIKDWNEYDDFETRYKSTVNKLERKMAGAVRNKFADGKLVYVESSTYCDEFGIPIQELNLNESYIATDNVIRWAIRNNYISNTSGKTKTVITNEQNSNDCNNKEDADNFVAYNSDCDDELPDDLNDKISMADVPWLRKKVKELTNEKVKWDKSIVAALKVGLQFIERGLTSDITKDAFAAEFANELKGLHKKTVRMIHKSLPIDCRNTGGSPCKEPECIDDETIDRIIEASIAAGLIYGAEEVKSAKDLEQKLARFEFDIPPEHHLKIISGACKRVLKKYKQAI